MANTKYKVIAGAVPLLHDRFKPGEGKEPKQGDILNEEDFKPGEIGELIAGGFIEQCTAPEVASGEKAAKKP